MEYQLIRHDANISKFSGQLNESSHRLDKLRTEVTRYSNWLDQAQGNANVGNGSGGSHHSGSGIAPSHSKLNGGVHRYINLIIRRLILPFLDLFFLVYYLRCKLRNGRFLLYTLFELYFSCTWLSFVVLTFQYN